MSKITPSVRDVYAALLAYYGKQEWWPGGPYEIIVGAVLVQNTNWRNVEKALANFNGLLSPGYILSLPDADLREIIRPSGFYTAKAECLKRVTEWYEKYDCSPAETRRNPREKVRAELTAIKGVGCETADAIMLYALRFPVFVVDAYTKRLLSRLGITVKQDYSSIQNYFENGLDADTGLYAGYHSLILAHSKRHCLKSPSCGGCPLAKSCGWGVSNAGRAAQRRG